MTNYQHPPKPLEPDQFAPGPEEWPPEVWEEGDDLEGVDPEMPDPTETDR